MQLHPSAVPSLFVDFLVTVSSWRKYSYLIAWPIFCGAFTSCDKLLCIPSGTIYSDGMHECQWVFKTVPPGGLHVEHSLLLLMEKHTTIQGDNIINMLSWMMVPQISSHMWVGSLMTVLLAAKEDLIFSRWTQMSACFISQTFQCNSLEIIRMNWLSQDLVFITLTRDD